MFGMVLSKVSTAAQRKAPSCKTLNLKELTTLNFPPDQWIVSSSWFLMHSADFGNNRTSWKSGCVGESVDSRGWCWSFLYLFLCKLCEVCKWSLSARQHCICYLKTHQQVIWLILKEIKLLYPCKYRVNRVYLQKICNNNELLKGVLIGFSSRALQYNQKG